MTESDMFNVGVFTLTHLLRSGPLTVSADGHGLSVHFVRNTAAPEQVPAAVEIRQEPEGSTHCPVFEMVLNNNKDIDIRMSV